MTEHDQTDSAPEPAAEVLFAEQGASWAWLLSGPAAAGAMLAIQLSSGMGVQWVVPISFLVLVSGFVALQVKAARIHTSVELTATHLRQGTQTIGVEEIVKVYPAPVDGGRRHYDGRILNRSNALSNRAMKQAGLDPAEFAEEEAPPPAPDTDRATVERWQSSRALGELTGVPRGRTGIGLRLTGKRTAQAWARNHAGLRAALTPLVEGRR
ncbi:DUF3093 domain-containing protein [[Mycobacterium] wendilense]|uniref:DUF3093 domain-containing protein n=1 Tax=[Mycobacterium] wendilense TaxID=3064284 RepID=A0ABN9P2J3_9MYCO|nr:DUF3093 domain-containing protein [Mycolicibacterium sp. MU0050]CAJ1585599.1 DUF3093 domain-containing protein [Mycolicibacterium sp. MU0050]